MIKTQMGFGALSCRCKKITAWTLAAITSLSLLGCGGGGGDREVVIAPESLDEIKMNFFNAYNLTFYRGAGTRGNETGAVSYEPIVSQFLFGQSSTANAAVANPVELPLIMTNCSYNYTRTSPTTGRIVFTYFNIQAFPYPNATSKDPLVTNVGTMFWDTTRSTTFDLVFSDDGGYLGDRVARVRSIEWFQSVWNGTTNSADNSYEYEEFNTPNVVSSTLTLGGRVPTGYDPYDQWESEQKPKPSKMVWETLNERTVYIYGQSDLLTVAFVKTGVDFGVEEKGSILIDTTNGIEGGSGTYEWNREGGTIATLRLEYGDYVGGQLKTVEREYKFTFTSLDGGTFTSNAGIGSFTQIKDGPL
jgi:hypothetical protein